MKYIDFLILLSIVIILSDCSYGVVSKNRKNEERESSVNEALVERQDNSEFLFDKKQVFILIRSD